MFFVFNLFQADYVHKEDSVSCSSVQGQSFYVPVKIVFSLLAIGTLPANRVGKMNKVFG